jgi:hypothetical protein
MPSVLVFTPTWMRADGSLAMRPECLESVTAQVFDGEYVHLVGLENPHPIGQHRNVLHQYQVAQAKLLAGEFDALLTVEHDNVLPDENTLQRMWDTPGDVIYAPYQLRHGAFVLNTWQYINDRNLGMPLNNYPAELARYRAAGVGRICGCGMGCTLFRRHTLQRIPFQGGGGEQWAPDIPFAEAALREGFVSTGRFDAPVAHWDGEVRLEAYYSVAKMKFLAIETVNALAAGEYVHLVAGEVIELLPAVASELSRAGYIRSLPDVGAAETASVQPRENAALPPVRRKRG